MVKDIFVFACYTGLSYSVIRSIMKITNNGSKKGIVVEIKTRVHPIEFLLDAYLRKHYKNRTGSLSR